VYRESLFSPCTLNDLTPFSLVTHSYTDILPKQCIPLLFQFRSADTNKAILLNFYNFPRRHAFAKVFLWEKSNHDYELYLNMYTTMEWRNHRRISCPLEAEYDLSNLNVLYLKTLLRLPMLVFRSCISCKPNNPSYDII
jgi:hypothetical protein